MALRRGAAVVFAASAALPCPVRAADFPPVTAEEKALTKVEAEPGAGAAVLYKKGTLRLRDLSSNERSSVLSVMVRLKVLTEEGRSFGEVTIRHSDSVRLSNFQGRTVSPSGKQIPLSRDARFERRASQARKQKVTSVAFPSVEVGSILDYSYELRFDSFYYLEPWYFSDAIPVLSAEMTWEIPRSLAVRYAMQEPTGKLQTEQKQHRGVAQLRAWAANLPSVPAEPHGFPFEDLAVRMFVIPMEYRDADVVVSLLESWPKVCEQFDAAYAAARRRASAATAKARALAAPHESEDEKARALHRFVRDEIETEPDEGVFVAEGASVDAVLSRSRGNSAEKALLLQAMLAAVGVKAQLLWAADRSQGTLDQEVPNPASFHRVLLAVQLPGRALYADPASRNLALGRLPPEFEGTAALAFDTKAPQFVNLPMVSFVANKRRSLVDLALDADGRLSGSGELELLGQHALARLRADRSPDDTRKDWSAWIGERLPGFHVTDVEVEQQLEDARLAVKWRLSARDENVLGDEVSLLPSRPVGPLKQPFLLSEAERFSPVLFDFADRNEAELRLAWPSGWSAASLPAAVSREAAMAGFAAECRTDAAGRSLVCTRRLDVRRRQTTSRQEFSGLREVFVAAEKADAQALVLARR